MKVQQWLWLETPMARLLIVKPEASFDLLFHVVLAQAGYVVIEAANSYEGQPAADMAGLADGRRARLLIVEADPHRRHRALPKSYPLGVPTSKAVCDGVSARRRFGHARPSQYCKAWHAKEEVYHE